MNSVEAHQELGKLLRFLKPLKNAEKALAAALKAESNQSTLDKEAVHLGHVVTNLRNIVEGLTTDRETAEAEVEAARQDITTEQATLLADQEKAADVREVLRADETRLQDTFSKLREELQAEIGRLQDYLSVLHEEEDRVDAKLAQFKALSHEQG